VAHEYLAHKNLVQSRFILSGEVLAFKIRGTSKFLHHRVNVTVEIVCFLQQFLMHLVVLFS
jgi:hypothetical protein